jgi:hypothetical protein
VTLGQIVRHCHHKVRVNRQESRRYAYRIETPRGRPSPAATTWHYRVVRHKVLALPGDANIDSMIRFRLGGANALDVYHMPTFIGSKINLYSLDLPRAIAVYSEMGFAETFRTPATGEPVHVELKLHGFTLDGESRATWIADPGGNPVQLVQRRC